MAAQLGVNCGGPDDDPAALAATGATFVRLVYRDTPSYRPWLTDLKQRGVECLFVGDSSPNSLGNDENQWAGRMTVARSNYGDLVKCFQWGNEPDGTGIASWTMPQTRVNRLLQIARSVFPREQGYTLVAPGLVSGDTNWPASLRFDLIDGLDAHPYAKDFRTQAQRDDLNGMLDRYLSYGVPLWLGEYDSRTQGLSGYLRDYPGVARAAVFCWDSKQTAAEGIHGMGIKDNPAAMASFLAATGGPVAAPPAEQHGDVQWAFQEGFLAWSQVQGDLLGKPDEPSEHGGIPGFSQLRTTRGILTWADLKQGEVFTFFDDGSRKRYRWQKGWGQAVEM